MFGIDFFAPIINPPESAVLGVGRIVKKAIVMKEEVVPRSMVTLTLVFDHRIMDGAVAARFLQTLKKNLERPADFFHG
jgi:pyruvate dehydrogenase E2 component (dihydrolipoamide acetyltransferase)